MMISASRLGNQQFQFTLNGLVAGKTNLIQGSTNLGSPVNWVSLKTNVAVSGSTNFIDVTAPASGLRFYRVIQLP